ncbi:MAG: hypothetical protein EXQ52_15100 [Bryobacterales bacterium]|nr:hypothetical protein [Bryobacterales bacterium]
MSRHINPNGHERSDADAGGAGRFAGFLGLAILVVMGLMWILFDTLAKREASRSPKPAPLAVTDPNALPPEPRLQRNPVEDLKAIRTEEEAVLTSYGWVDPEKGIVRIPVSEAIKLMAQRPPK